MKAKGTGRTPLYGTSTKKGTVQVQGYDNIPAVRHPCTPHVPTGYHLSSLVIWPWSVRRLSIRLLRLALRRYVRVLLVFQLRRTIISALVNPGLSRMKAASWCCAGFASVICRIWPCRSLRNTMDWRKPLLPRLQAQHDATKLSRASVPPSASATLWSTSRRILGAACPQYWQVKWSRARTSQRSLYHPFRSIRFVIAILYSTRGVGASVVGVPLYCMQGEQRNDENT